MKLSHFARGMLFASALAMSGLVSGCGTSETNAQSALQSSSLSSQSNPVTAGAVQILLVNDFGALPTPTPNPQKQILSSAAGPNSNIPGENATQFSETATVDLNLNQNIPTPPSSVLCGNLVLSINDVGTYAPSGTVNGTVDNNGSSNNNTFAPSSVVWTAITPDRVFAYEISGLQTYAQSVNVTPPSNSTALTAFANLTTGAGTINGTAISSTNGSAAVLQRGYFGDNQITENRLLTDGTFQSPANQLPILTKQNVGTYYYAIAHPSGSFLYVFGDRWDNVVYPTATTTGDTDPGGVALPTSLDTVSIDGNPNLNDTTDPYRPQLINANNQVTLTYLAHATSSNRTRIERGTVSVYSINRSTAQLTNLDNFLLPAGYAGPKWATFGPNGNDIYISCYSVANDTTINGVTTSGFATKGGVVHYRLTTGNTTGTFGTSEVLTGNLSNGSNTFSSDYAGGRVPVENFDLPRGALGMCTSQGMAHLYVACQLDGFPTDAELRNPATLFPGTPVLQLQSGNVFASSGHSGSLQGFDIDPNTGNLTYQPSYAVVADETGVTNNLSYPGYISANPVIDVFYVASNGGTLNLQTDANQARFVSVRASTASATSWQVASTAAGAGTISEGSANNALVDGFANYQTIDSDPTGTIVYALAGASPPPYDLSGTSPGYNGVPEVQQTGFTGGPVAYQAQPLQNSLTLLGTPGLTGLVNPVTSTVYQVLQQAATVSGTPSAAGQ